MHNLRVEINMGLTLSRQDLYVRLSGGWTSNELFAHDAYLVREVVAAPNFWGARTAEAGQ